MKRFLGAALLLSMTACNSGPVHLERDVVRVVVLPPYDESSTPDLEASNKLWPHVQQQVAARGYSVVPQSEVVAFYQKNKYNQPAEIEHYKAQEIAELFKAQGVFYTHIIKWGKTATGISNWVGVQLEAVLVDGKNNEAAWSGKGEDGKGSGGLNLRDALGSAAGTLLTDPGQFAPGAARNCYRALPRAGFAPVKK